VTLVQLVVTFLILWWLILFMVLPWGVTQEEDPIPGQERGAPARPRLLLKFAITTLLAGLATWGVAVAIGSGLISFRP
jgi:predicted secreted protein